MNCIKADASKERSQDHRPTSSGSERVENIEDGKLISRRCSCKGMKKKGKGDEIKINREKKTGRREIR